MDANQLTSQLQEVLKVYSYLWSLPAYKYLVVGWASLGAVAGLIPLVMAFKRGQRAAGIQSFVASVSAAMFSPLLLLVITPLSIAMIRANSPARDGGASPTGTTAE